MTTTGLKFMRTLSLPLSLWSCLGYCFLCTCCCCCSSFLVRVPSSSRILNTNYRSSEIMTMLDHHSHLNGVVQKETELQQVTEQQNLDKLDEVRLSTAGISGSSSSSSSSSYSNGSSLLQSRLWSTTTVKSLSMETKDDNENENDFDDHPPFQIVMDSPDFQNNNNNLPTTDEDEKTNVSTTPHNKNLVQLKTLVWEVIWKHPQQKINNNEKYEHPQNDLHSNTTCSSTSSHPNHPPPQTTYIVTALRMEDQVDTLLLEKLLWGRNITAHFHDTAAQSSSSLSIPTITGLAPRPVAEQLTGYESGTMAPICHSTSMDLYVDQSLFVPQHNKIMETATTTTGVQASMGSGTKGYSLIMTFKDMMKVARETSKQLKVGSFIRRTSSNVTATQQQQQQPRKQKSSPPIPPPYTTLRRRGQKQPAHQAPPKDRLHEYRSLTSMEDKAKLLRSTVRKKGRFPEVRNLIEEACAQDEFVDLMYVDPLNGKPAKNAFHLAAWKGDLESVMLLVETSKVVCPELDLVNRVSTGIGSYGKTPIFYALTQCRDDVVRYLLDKGGASLLIVNNKGQTPCSIAISHLSTETCEYMQKLESQQLQQGGTFQNYRLSHSDEKFYGDLDPRFPLDSYNAGEDVQEALTTYHQSLSQQQDGVCDDIIPTSFQPRSLRPTTRWWNRQDQSLEAANRDTSGTCITFTQPRPLTNKTKTKTKTKQHQKRSPTKLNKDFAVAPSKFDVESLDKLVLDDVLLGLSVNNSDNQGEKDVTTSRRYQNITYVVDLEGIEELAASIDECTIQSGEGAIANTKCIDDNDDNNNDDDSLLVKSSCWGLDCEWKPGLDFGKFSPVATLQLSTRHRSFLVDLQLLCRSSSFLCKEDGLLSTTTRTLTVLEQKLSDALTKLFVNPRIPILGYGVLQDLTKLAGSFPHLPCFALYHNVIDLQGMASHVYPTTSARRRGGQPQQQMSSLQRMVAILVGKRLDKSEQCSDWSRRPLTKEQLEYATLDAAVLPLLFHTMLEDPTFQKTHEGKFFHRNAALRSSLRYTVLERVRGINLSDNNSEEEPAKYHVPHGTTKISMLIRLARQSWPTKESPPELPKRLGHTTNTQSLPFAAAEKSPVAKQGQTTTNLQYLLQPPKSKPPKRRPPPVQLSVMTGDLENLPIPGTFIGYTKESCIFRILGADQISKLPKHTYIGFNRRSGIVETTNAWILFVNFGQRSNDNINTDTSSSSANLFNQFICGGRQLNFSVKPTRTTEKSLIDYYSVYSVEKDFETVQINNHRDTEKAILLFARPSTRTKYVFCGECECKHVSTCTDGMDEKTVDMLLELMDFSKCVGQADYIHAFGQSNLDLNK